LDPRQPAPASSVASQLEKAVAEVPGWTPVDQLLTLFNLAVASSHLGGDLLEIGSWCGRSAVALGLAARLTGGTRVHCIDLFPARDDWRQNPDGSYAMRVSVGGEHIEAYQEATVWREPFERDIAPLYVAHESVHDIFCSTIRAHQLTDLVTDYRGTSEIARDLHARSRRFRLAFIDGDHGYDAVSRDIANVEPALLPGGWLCFDDACTTFDGVDRAVQDHVISSPAFDLAHHVTRKLFVARKRLG
jgi:predicted O-methyltransferase YrrM